MTQEQTGFSAEKRADNDNRKSRTGAPPPNLTPAKPQQATLRQRWDAFQPSKMVVFWLCLASVLLTLLVGFTWGGWQRSSVVTKNTATASQAAVVDRLATICVAQFNLDPQKEQKLAELQAESAFRRAEYVTTQGWATAPGDEKPVTRVADTCAKQLMLLNP